jgi:uncharacterized FlgJ-related protein
MLKKTLISAILIFATFISATEARLPHTAKLIPKAVVVLAPREVIYLTLTTNHDSITVLNGRDTVTCCVVSLDTIMARIVVAQAAHESGDFSSPLALLHNNYFGMMHPGRGKLTTSLGGKGYAEGRYGYAHYKSIEDSAIDLMLWLEFNKFARDIRSADKYCILLKQHHYYEAPVKVYSTNLKRYLKIYNGQPSHNRIQKSV